MSNRPFVLSTACAALVFSGAASALAAQDVALVVGNENYRNASDISAADDAGDAADVLADDGFTVLRGNDMSAVSMAELLAR